MVGSQKDYLEHGFNLGNEERKVISFSQAYFKSVFSRMLHIYRI